MIVLKLMIVHFVKALNKFLWGSSVAGIPVYGKLEGSNRPTPTCELPLQWLIMITIHTYNLRAMCIWWFMWVLKETANWNVVEARSSELSPLAHAKANILSIQQGGGRTTKGGEVDGVRPVKLLVDGQQEPLQQHAVVVDRPCVGHVRGVKGTKREKVTEGLWLTSSLWDKNMCTQSCAQTFEFRWIYRNQTWSSNW